MADSRRKRIPGSVDGHECFRFTHRRTASEQGTFEANGPPRTRTGEPCLFRFASGRYVGADIRERGSRKQKAGGKHSAAKPSTVAGSYHCARFFRIPRLKLRRGIDPFLHSRCLNFAYERRGHHIEASTAIYRHSKFNWPLLITTPS